MPWLLQIFLLCFLTLCCVTGNFVYPVKFILHPEILSVNVTTGITLFCKAYVIGGTGNIHYAWYFIPKISPEKTISLSSNTRLSSGRRLFEMSPDLGNITLDFLDASSEYNGEYYCNATFGTVVAKSRSALYVFDGADNDTIFVIEPEFASKLISTKASLMCKTKEISSLPTIDWYFSPEGDPSMRYNLGNSEYTKYDVNLFQITMFQYSSVLDLVYSSQDYAGEYSCFVKYGRKKSHSKPAHYKYDRGGTKKDYPFPVALSVLGSDIDAQIAESDKPISLVCKVVEFDKKGSNSTFEYKWVYAGVAAEEQHAKVLTNDDRYQIEYDKDNDLHLLKFVYASPDYDGIYKCVVYGRQSDGQKVYSVSEPGSNFLYSGPKYVPKFVRQPSFNLDSVTQLVTRANVSLTCNVTQPPHFPPATIKWWFGKCCDEMTRVILNPTDTLKQFKLKFSSDNTVITFTNYAPINNGTYHCVATNSRGDTPSDDIVYQFGGYIKMSEDSDTSSLYCNYTSHINVKVENKVVWSFEKFPGSFEELSEKSEDYTIKKDDSQGVSILKFNNLKAKNLGRYKCSYIEASRWAYGFYNFTASKITSNTRHVRNGDEIQMNCTCTLDLGQDGAMVFKFYLNRKSGVKALESSNKRHIKAYGAYSTLIIPFARQTDSGYYECGYVIDKMVKFVPGGVMVEYEKVKANIDSFPFGFGKVNRTANMWKPIYDDLNVKIAQTIGFAYLMNPLWTTLPEENYTKLCELSLGHKSCPRLYFRHEVAGMNYAPIPINSYVTYNTSTKTNAELVYSVYYSFPNYTETLVAPAAKYTVLYMGMDPNDMKLECTACNTDSKGSRSHCPFGSMPRWTFNTGYKKDDFAVTYQADEQIDPVIRKVEMKIGQQYNCTYSFTDKITNNPTSVTASQDIIVEARPPLKMESDVELPIKGIEEKVLTLRVYVDIQMRRSLYSKLMTVKWGRIEGDSVTWYNYSARQINDWMTQRLSLTLENPTNGTYVCALSYLDRKMRIDIPVVLISQPKGISELNTEQNGHTDALVRWDKPKNEVNNYFLQYHVYISRKSLNDGPVQSEEQTFSSSQTNYTIPSPIPYTNYTVTIQCEFETGRSTNYSTTFITLESVPSAPTQIITGKEQDQVIEGDKVLFSLTIKAPSEPNGKIIGYRITLLVNTTESEKRKRSTDKIWTQEITHDDPGFKSDGGFEGTVGFEYDKGLARVAYISVAAKTSQGYGTELKSEFYIHNQLFKSSSKIMIIVLCIAVFIILVLVAAAVLFVFYRQKKSPISNFRDEYNPIYKMTRSVVPDQWEVNKDNLIISKTIGEGAFGRVMKATLEKDGVKTAVACKMLREESCNETDAEALWKEIALMKKVGSHPYIVNIIGCVTVKPPICLLVEFVQNGDLQSYLRQIRPKFEAQQARCMRTISLNQSQSTKKGILQNHQNGKRDPADDDPLLNASDSEYINMHPDLTTQDSSYINLENVEDEHELILTSKDMLNMMYQIACGMQYLTYKNIIHRDLAARNILVGADLEVKVSDFGLARDMYLEQQYLMNPRGRVPFKWMSPEALFDLKFTSKSDVWSYGVLLWEIITLGGSPYPGIEPAKLYKLLKGGYRMARPDGCSLELYDIMKDCWDEDPDMRPPFDDLSQTIGKMLKHDSSDYLDIGQGMADIHEDEEMNTIELVDEPEVVEAEQYVVPDTPSSPLIPDTSSSPLTPNTPSSPLVPRSVSSQHSNPLKSSNEYSETCI